MAQAPVVYGASTRPPRGDYSQAGADYVCDQNWASYRDHEHALFARLYERQQQQLPGQACDEFITALGGLDLQHGIPHFEEVSARLHRITGWEIVAVPGLIPESAFFSLLAARRFPVTVWLRRPEEFDYIVEPDVFHDLFGHVPLLFDPVFADYMQAFGRGGLKAQGLQALEFLARLYWYTVEFGLIQSPHGLRVYGAGILSSASETVHSLADPRPARIAFDLQRVLRTPYRIDEFQDPYFVVESFQKLFDATAPDFTPLYRQISSMPALAMAPLPGERIYMATPSGKK